MDLREVKLVDASVLIYAINSDAPHHERSRRWLEEALSGTEPGGMSWAVLIAFLRIITRRGILERRLPVDDAVDYIDSWLRQPSVELAVAGPNHWAILRTLILTSGSAGNLLPTLI